VYSQAHSPSLHQLWRFVQLRSNLRYAALHASPSSRALASWAIFDLAAEERTWVIGQHFPPFPSLGHVVKQGEGWEWQPMNPAQ